MEQSKHEVFVDVKSGKTRMTGPNSTERAENTTITITRFSFGSGGEVDDFSMTDERAKMRSGSIRTD